MANTKLITAMFECTDGELRAHIKMADLSYSYGYGVDDELARDVVEIFDVTDIHHLGIKGRKHSVMRVIGAFADDGMDCLVSAG